MRTSFKAVCCCLILFHVSVLAASNETASLLPDKIESFQALNSASVPGDEFLQRVNLEDVGQISAAARSYRDDAGALLTIEVVNTQSDSAAYALLTRLALGSEIKTDIVGIAGATFPNRLLFYKGNVLVELSFISSAISQDRLLELAQKFATTLPNGDDEVPVLVEHLPNAPTMANHAAYAVTLNGLKAIAKNQPILDSLDFAGGTEAVAANYGQSQLVIVEFTTPQFSVDNDQRIWTRLAELKSQKQPVPTAYRRVGNYSVFVFDAPDERAANQLIDQVQYQKVVQWLGEDPHLYEKLSRYLTRTSANVLMAVLKSSGVSLVVCFGVGVLFGFLLFRHRRAQKAALYSDAGGSVRLNLDQLTGRQDASRLLDSPPNQSNPSNN